MTKLNGKDMEVWLKRGMGTQKIASELQISNTELLELIDKSFACKGAKVYRRRLAKNDKALSKKEKDTVDNKETVETTIDAETETIGTPVETPKLSLAELREEEEKQQKKTANQEIVVKGTIQQYRKVLEEVCSKTEQVSNLIVELTTLKEEIGLLEERAIFTLENHDIELDKLHDEQEKLKNIREEIAKRSIVNVFLYSNGDILIENEGIAIDTDFDGWKEKKELLEEKHEGILSDLPLKYIKQLAKFMCLPHLTDEQHYEVSFELAEMQEVYNRITSEEEED